MKLTNKKGYPEALYLAIKNDPYSKGDSDFSVTELISPPRIKQLQRIHDEELEEDMESRLWSLYGQVAHGIVERSNVSEIVEVRYFGQFGQWRVSGQVDSLCLHNGVLSDYKFTSVGSFMQYSKPKPDWVQQLNMQLELLRMNGLDASVLQIVGLLRDFNKNKRDPRHEDFDPYYPPNPVAKHLIPVWEREQTVRFIEKRIKAHVDAKTKLPRCKVDEHWSTRRCRSYCNVAKFCEQYKEILSKPKGVTHAL